MKKLTIKILLLSLIGFRSTSAADALSPDRIGVTVHFRIRNPVSNYTCRLKPGSTLQNLIDLPFFSNSSSYRFWFTEDGTVQILEPTTVLRDGGIYDAYAYLLKDGTGREVPIDPNNLQIDGSMMWEDDSDMRILVGDNYVRYSNPISQRRSGTLVLVTYIFGCSREAFIPRRHGITIGHIYERIFGPADHTATIVDRSGNKIPPETQIIHAPANLVLRPNIFSLPNGNISMPISDLAELRHAMDAPFGDSRGTINRNQITFRILKAASFSLRHQRTSLELLSRNLVMNCLFEWSKKKNIEDKIEEIFSIINSEDATYSYVMNGGEFVTSGALEKRVVVTRNRDPSGNIHTIEVSVVNGPRMSGDYFTIAIAETLDQSTGLQFVHGGSPMGLLKITMGANGFELVPVPLW